MQTDWREALLGDVAAELTVGHVGPMADEYVPVGIPFLRSQNIEPHRINTEDVKFISEEFHTRLRKSALRPGDVVIVRTGRPGAAAVIPPTLSPANCADLVIIHPGEKIDSRFLAYYINSVAAGHVDAHLVGAVQQHFNVESARQIRLRLPPLPEQRAIAHILGTLDDKIDLNRRMNETLEAMARAIFKCWFVDFDPVRAKAEGRQPEGMDAETAALFPDGFEDSALGKIPRGWRVGRVYEIADVIYGAPFSSKLFNSTGNGLPLIRIRDLATHRPEVFTSEEHPNGRVIRSGDVVVGMDGEFRIHHWRGEPALLNQRVCCFEPKPGVSRVFVSETISEPMAFFERSKTGTTVIHLGKADIDTFRVLVPSNEVQSAFAKLAEPLLEGRLAAAQESRTLAAIRDALLPKLLSGEIRVDSPVSPKENCK